MSRTRAVALRRAPAPHVPRRVSGPAARPTPVPGRPRPATPITASHPAVGALRALPDARLLDTLLRSRAWIWLLGIALGGIVFMQVSLLQMNNAIGNAVAKSTALENTNALLAQEVAELSSGELIKREAERQGLITPDAGDVDFVTARGELDARRAIDNMAPPSDTARGVIATNGLPPEALAPVATAEPVATAAPPTDYATTP